MRRLIQFLTKFRDFLIFLVLQFIVLSFFFNTRNYHQAKLANTSSSVVGWFMERKYNITKHFSLEEQNLQLLEENAQLKALLPESNYLLQENLVTIDNQLYEKQYSFIPARVINISDNRRDNYITIDKGRLQGIEEDMGVITDNGAIGVVLNVSDHYSLVKTVLSENIRLGVKSSKNNEYWIMNWEGINNEVTRIDNVKRDIDVAIGDTVVTRGDVGRFPVGVPIGTVDEIIDEDGNPQLSINVRLFVDFSSVYHVYIVKNKLRKEQEELEALIHE